MKHGYESTPIEEVRQILKNEYKITDENIVDKTKLELVDILLELKNKKLDEVNDEVIDTPFVVSQEEPVNRPSFNSVEWNKYVLGQLAEDEKDGENPLCDGLRRLTELLIGPILSRCVEVVPPHINNNFTSTVKVSITIFINNEDHPANGQTVVEESVAECGSHNTESPYDKFQSATAETRAEARALRKILRLRKVVAAEELAGNVTEQQPILNWQPEDSISNEQIEVLDRIASRCDVDVLSFINCGSKQYNKIKEVSKGTATEMIKYLNSIAQGIKAKPDNVGKYNSNWRAGL